jgi:hypothetical protein
MRVAQRELLLDISVLCDDRLTDGNDVSKIKSDAVPKFREPLLHIAPLLQKKDLIQSV